MKPRKKLSSRVEILKLRRQVKLLKQKLGPFQPKPQKKTRPMKPPARADYEAYLRAYGKR